MGWNSSCVAVEIGFWTWGTTCDLKDWRFAFVRPKSLSLGSIWIDIDPLKRHWLYKHNSCGALPLTRFDASLEGTTLPTPRVYQPPTTANACARPSVCGRLLAEGMDSFSGNGAYAPQGVVQGRTAFRLAGGLEGDRWMTWSGDWQAWVVAGSPGHTAAFARLRENVASPELAQGLWETVIGIVWTSMAVDVRVVCRSLNCPTGTALSGGQCYPDTVVLLVRHHNKMLFTTSVLSTNGSQYPRGSG